MLQYRPLKFFWIAEFTDGTAVSQFDPDSGTENSGHPDWLPSKVDKDGMIIKDGKKVLYSEAYPIPKHFAGKEIKRIGWYPFSFSFTKKIFEKTGKFAVPTKFNPFVLELKGKEKPLCYRTHSIKINMRKGTIEYAELVYVLGIKGKTVKHINERGEILNGK